MAYSWKVLADDWSALTDTEKEALFVGTNYQTCAQNPQLKLQGYKHTEQVSLQGNLQVDIANSYAIKKLNCWNTIKSTSLQHKHEIRLSVNVAKAERSKQDGTGLNPKYYIIGNQQVSPEQGKLQRLSFLRGVHSKLLTVEVVSPKPQKYGMDKIQSVLT